MARPVYRLVERFREIMRRIRESDGLVVASGCVAAVILGFIRHAAGGPAVLATYYLGLGMVGGLAARLRETRPEFLLGFSSTLFLFGALMKYWDVVGVAVFGLGAMIYDIVYRVP